MPLFENNLSPYLTIVEATEPSAPSAGQQRLYIDSTTHLFKATDSSGTDRTLEGLVDPMSTRGDIIIRNASNVTARLGIGSNGKVLQSDGTDISWQTPAAGAFVGCRAYNATAQTVSTEATILFGADEYDTNTIHTGANTGILTIPSAMAGKWRFTYNLAFIGNHGASYAYIRKGGTTAIRGSEIDFTATTDQTAHCVVTIVVAVSDTLEIRAFRTTSGSIGTTNLGTMSTFEAQYLGA